MDRHWRADYRHAVRLVVTRLPIFWLWAGTFGACAASCVHPLAQDPLHALAAAGDARPPALVYNACDERGTIEIRRGRQTVWRCDHPPPGDAPRALRRRGLACTVAPPGPLAAGRYNVKVNDARGRLRSSIWLRGTEVELHFERSCAAPDELRMTRWHPAPQGVALEQVSEDQIPEWTTGRPVFDLTNASPFTLVTADPATPFTGNIETLDASGRGLRDFHGPGCGTIALFEVRIAPGESWRVNEPVYLGPKREYSPEGRYRFRVAFTADGETPEAVGLPPLPSRDDPRVDARDAFLVFAEFTGASVPNWLPRTTDLRWGEEASSPSTAFRSAPWPSTR